MSGRPRRTCPVCHRSLRLGADLTHGGECLTRAYELGLIPKPRPVEPAVPEDRTTSTLSGAEAYERWRAEKAGELDPPEIPDSTFYDDESEADDEINGAEPEVMPWDR